jgi:NAD-dependent dihydropyrimidine dehydrogenase PreA subunit
MEAIQLEDAPETINRVTTVTTEKGRSELKNKRGKVAVVNTGHCFGCGVCAYKCPTGSLILERRAAVEPPPRDGREYLKLVTADIAAGRARSEQDTDK